MAGLVAAYRIGRPVVLLAGAAWIFAAGLLPGAYPPRAGAGPDWRPARARVSDLHLIDDIVDSHRSDGFALLQPYQIVELSFVPGGRRDTVIAVDAVDSGSVMGLGRGAVLPVRYDPAAPRRAVLAAGRRGYPERNRPIYWFLAAGLPASLTVLSIWALSRRGRPAERSS